MTAISLTRALVEIKTLGERIERQIPNTAFVALSKGRKAPKPAKAIYPTTEDAISAIKSGTDKVTSLIARRQKLKSALNKANVETTLRISGVEMSIADALDYKEILKFKQLVLDQARRQRQLLTAEIETNRQQMEAKAQQSFEKSVESEQSRKTTEATSLLSLLREAQFDAHELSLIDPLKIDSFIEKLETEIQAATDELDFALSEINARTTIEVE